MAANTINHLNSSNTFQHWLSATDALVTRVNLLTNGNGDIFFANTELRIGGAGANVSLNVETGASINVTTGNTVNTVNLVAREVVVTGNVTSETTITLDSGAGLFQRDEIVYQSADGTYANAFATAIVHGWDSVNKKLTIAQVNGTFVGANATYGKTSAANWNTLAEYAGFTFSKPNVAFPTNVHVNRDLYVDGDIIVTGNLTLDTVGFDDLSVSGSGTFGNTLTVTGVSTLSNVVVTGNVATLNVTNDTNLGKNLTVYGTTTVTGATEFKQNVLIDGDLTVSGNIVLDQIGYDDITANGSVYVGNNLTVIGTTNFTGNVTSGNVTVQNTLTANIVFANNLIGPANTAIYDAMANVESKLAESEGIALAFSIALG